MIVKVIAMYGESSIVEWSEEGFLHRSIVPSKDVNSGGECINPWNGLPYGLPFAELLSVDITPEQIEQALHAHGIWTTEDVIHNSSQVHGAINAAFSNVLSKLLRDVKAYNSGGTNVQK